MPKMKTNGQTLLKLKRITIQHSIRLDFRHGCATVINLAKTSFDKTFYQTLSLVITIELYLRGGMTCKKILIEILNLACL